MFGWGVGVLDVVVPGVVSGMPNSGEAADSDESDDESGIEDFLVAQ